MTIRILILALITVMFGAGPPPSTISTQQRPLSFFAAPHSDHVQKHPDVAMEKAMAARAHRARLKAEKIASTQRSLSEILLDDNPSEINETPESPDPKPPVVKSAWKQRPAPKPKRPTWVVIQPRISPALRKTFSGTRWFCYGKCGR